MAQKDINKDIGDYLKHRQETEIRIVDLDKIKKQASNKTVEEAHPDLEDGKVHIIQKDDSWLKKLVKKKQEAKQEEQAPDFEEAEKQIESHQGYFSRFVGWVKGEELETPTPKEFEAEMEQLEEKEEEIIEHEAKDKEQIAELHAERSKSIWGFMGRFRQKEKPNVLQEEVFTLEEDLKSIAKITTNVMRKIPAEELTTYKDGEEFKRFKEILKKRNLIKEKPRGGEREEKDRDA
ncbi:MAG: hypothetical protein V1837_06555 [Candidatus Woesearchaeota archaeon]